MHAIQMHETGGPEVLRYEEVVIPEPASGQVRINVAAIGLNYIDTYHRSGLYPQPMPFIPGAEVAGSVDAIGPDVVGFAIGDQVATASGLGGYADYAIAPAARLVHVPAGVDLQLAAAVMLQGMTAHYLAYSTYPLKPGETCLIHAAAGGVGLILVQIAKQIGVRVIGTVSTEEKAVLARAAGADEIIFYNQEPVAERVRALTNNRGVDVVYDSVGKNTWEGSLASLRPRGMMVSFGNASGPVAPISPLVLGSSGSLFLSRPIMGHYIATPEELAWRAGDLFSWIAANTLKLRIDRTYPLAEAAAAHIALEGRATAGKVLLLP